MLKKITILLLNITILAAPLQAQQKPTPSPIELLTTGILTANQKLVKNALKQPVPLRVRIDQYGDTPLMVSVRMLGQSMKNVAEQRNNALSRWVTASCKLSILQLLMTATSTLVPDAYKKTFFAGNCLALIGTILLFVRENAKPSITAERAATIITLLVQQDPQFDVRNYEGLNAHELLLAYYPLAKDLQFKEWFQLRSIFDQLKQQ